MKILGLIPARGGSKGVPFKNRKKLAGKPLVNYTIEAALESQSFHTVMVSTEDSDIADISKTAGAEVPFLRPNKLADDTSPTIDTVVHAIDFYKTKNIFFDAICLLQPTCPFRTSEDIVLALKAFEKSQADCLISVREVPHQYNPHWVFEAKGDSSFLQIATGEKDIIPRRQELPRAYHRDGSIYITSMKVLENSRSLYGEKIAWHLSQNPCSINIDTIEDWIKAESILRRQSETK